jgi:P-loop containing dynein motor region
VLVSADELPLVRSCVHVLEQCKPHELNLYARFCWRLLPQATLEARMIRLKRDLLGAPEGCASVVFVDDINMPQVRMHSIVHYYALL